MYSSKLGKELIFEVWQSDFKPPNFIMYIHNVYDNTFIHSDISLPTFYFTWFSMEKHQYSFLALLDGCKSEPLNILLSLQ